MTFENTVSKVPYKVGTILQDDITSEVFEVVNCYKIDDRYRVKLKKLKENLTYQLLDKLNDAINKTNLHDKDIFMLENIISEIKDSLK